MDQSENAEVLIELRAIRKLLQELLACPPMNVDARQLLNSAPAAWHDADLAAAGSSQQPDPPTDRAAS